MSSDARDNFLIECCRIAKGDIKSRIPIREVLDRVKIDLSYEQAFDNIVLPLVSEGFIRGDPEQEEITLCRKSFYYVIKITGESAYNFGMVPYLEAKILSVNLLKDLCLSGKLDLSMFTFDGYKGETVNQVIEILEEEKLIVFTDNHRNAEITENGRIEILKNLAE